MSLQEHRPPHYELYGFQLSVAESKDVLGTTYKAVESSGKTTVAVQVCQPLVGRDPVLIEALEAYAIHMSKLAHANIQRVISFENGNQGSILVKEYIEGIRFDAYLRRKGVLDWQHALMFIKQLLLGLSCAHNAGFVHRSLAPDNIFIARGNTAKLTDIGLTHVIKENGYLSEEEWHQSTARKYAAPEAFAEAFKTANKASDIYSIGLIAYEMLTGISPDRDSDSLNRKNHLAQPVNPLHLVNRAVPEELALVIQKATEHSAIRRFPDAEAMLKAIDAISTFSVKPNVIYYSKRKFKVRSLLGMAKVLLLIGVMLGLLSAGYFYFQINNKNPFLALQNDQLLVQPLGEANAANPSTPENERPADTLTITPEGEIPIPLNPGARTPELETQNPEPEVAAALPPSSYSLIIRSNPSGASTSVNGKEMGTTPFHLANINSEKMAVVLSLAGHKEVSQEILLGEDDVTEAFFNLIPVNRHLIITVLPWGNIYLDGELVSERVSGTDTLMISPERVTLSVIHPVLGSWEKLLNQTSDNELAYAIDFRKHASLRITAFDDGQQTVAGEVILNGKNLNMTTPVTIELPLGKHAIEVIAAGFEPFKLQTTIDLENGQPKPLNLQLKRK